MQILKHFKGSSHKNLLRVYKGMLHLPFTLPFNYVHNFKKIYIVEPVVWIRTVEHVYEKIVSKPIYSYL